MTEYKKLVLLVDEFSEDVAGLCSSVTPARIGGGCQEERLDGVASSSEAADPEKLFSVSLRIQQSLADGCPRIRKMVLKARETDPNRQIYNETMCTKIEELFNSFCSALKKLAPDYSIARSTASTEDKTDEESLNPFEDILNTDFNTEEVVEHSLALQTVEDIHNRYLVKRAKEEAWQSRVAGGLNDVVTFEAQNRALTAAEEKFDRTALIENKRLDKVRIIHLLEEREAIKWNGELRRRDVEQRHLVKSTKEIDSIAAIPLFLQTVVPDAAIRQKLVGRVRRLIAALLRAPEDPNIRRLRNNNEHLFCDYGHPCLAALSLTDNTHCACASTLHAAEVLWCKMGYSIRYTNVPNRIIESLRLEKRAETLLLPCGLPLSSHSYTSLGFEDYSERFMELIEPDVMERADEWMVWYTMMQDMERVLANMAGD